MALTKAEIRKRVGSMLKLIRVGQAPQDQDKVRIDQGYDEVYQDLKTDSLAVWAETGSVPTELVPHVASLIAFNCLDTYPVSNDLYVRIINKASIAKPEIRRLITPKYESLEEATNY